MIKTNSTEERPSSRLALCFLWSSFTIVCAAFVALAILRIVTLPAAVLDDDRRRGAIAYLPADEIAALKLRHADESPAYDVGLFGNSRIMMVGSDELALHDRRVFNFAIGGQSIRQSLHLLEELHAHRKAPAIAVISMDHVELGLPGGASVFPGPPRRWLDSIHDVWIALKQQGIRGAAVQIVNAAASEGQQLAITFNRIYVLHKLRALAGAAEPLNNFRADGSQEETRHANPGSIDPLLRRADTYPQLESDFARLAAIRNSGVRILVYESPIAPILGGTTDRDLSANARNVRHRFHGACISVGLECFGPPLLTGKPWFDSSHAPASQLATWLRPLIEQRN